LKVLNVKSREVSSSDYYVQNGVSFRVPSIFFTQKANDNRRVLSFRQSEEERRATACPDLSGRNLCLF